MDLQSVELEDALARKKILYEEKHPETIRGTAGGKSIKTTSDNLSFVKHSAQKLNVNGKTVERAVARSNGSSSQVKKARENGDIGASQTDELIKLSKEQQNALLPVIIGKDVTVVREAVQMVDKIGIEETIKNMRHISDAKKFFIKVKGQLSVLDNSICKALSDGLIYEGIEGVHPKLSEP